MKNQDKIAICFHGIHGSTNSGKNYQVTDFDKGFNDSSEDVLITVNNHLEKNILQQNDVDIFFHTWDVQLENKMVELYQPVDYKVEAQKKFHIPNFVGSYNVGGGGYSEQRGQAHYSRWYSFKEVNKLKEKYEKENNFQYDLVMQSRLDLCWTEILSFSKEFNPDYFYTSTPVLSQFLEYPDRWFISSSNKMNEFSKLYDLITDYCNPESSIGIPQYAGISSHFMVADYLNNKLKYKIKHTLPYRDKHLMYRDLNE